MDEIIIDKVLENMGSLIGLYGHISKVTKESRQQAMDSAISLNITPLEHSRVMAIIKDWKISEPQKIQNILKIKNKVKKLKTGNNKNVSKRKIR